ncbi:hypothetical protein GCM10020256_33300 [Streptomyces thermocoprophilus]
MLRSLLAPTRTLLVLDDAASAAQVRPLLPAGPGCAVVITSRSPLTALDGARRVPLAPLSAQDSAALLRAVSGRDGLDADHPLVDLSGRLPLALRVLGARLAARRALTPEVLADQLAATESRLPHLEYDDLSVRRSLAVAHDALARGQREADRDAAVALRHIGALDLPSYGATLVAHLIGADERRAEAALDRLVDVALLEETAYGRYAPHDLVRDFARELAATGGDDTATSHATGPDALGGDPRVPAPDPLGRGGRTTDTGPDGTPAAGPEAVSGGTPRLRFRARFGWRLRRWSRARFGRHPSHRHRVHEGLRPLLRARRARRPPPPSPRSTGTPPSPSVCWRRSSSGGVMWRTGVSRPPPNRRGTPHAWRPYRRSTMRRRRSPGPTPSRRTSWRSWSGPRTRPATPQTPGSPPSCASSSPACGGAAGSPRWRCSAGPRSARHAG